MPGTRRTTHHRASRNAPRHGCTYSTSRCISADVTCGYPRARERVSGQGRWPTARHSRDLCRLDVRKAAAGPRSTGAPSPRMRRAGRAAQRDDDTARRARPCACIRRYNPEEPPTPSPPAPCYTCATIAPRLIFSWRRTTLICYGVPPKPPSPPPHQRKPRVPPNLHFWSFVDRSWSQEQQQHASAFQCCPSPSNPNPLPPLPLPTRIHCLRAANERFHLSTSSSGTSTRSAASGIGGGGGGDDCGGDDDNDGG